MGSTDPRSRRDSQGAQTDLELQAPLYVTNDGKIALDVSGSLEVAPDGSLFIRVANGLTVAPGSPLTLQLLLADDSMEITKGGVQARPSSDHIRLTKGAGLTRRTLTEALSAEVEKIANRNVANGYAGLDSSGNLPVARGGTGRNTFVKGDLTVGTAGASLTSLSVGSNGQVLTADSSATNGVKWAAATDASVATARLSSDVTTTSSSASNVTGLSFAIGASEVWLFEFNVMSKCSAANGHKWALDLPSSATVAASLRGSRASVASILSEDITADDTLSTAIGTGTYTSGGWVQIVGMVTASSTAGTVQLRFASATGGDTTTAKAGSFLIARKVS